MKKRSLKAVFCLLMVLSLVLPSVLALPVSAAGDNQSIADASKGIARVFCIGADNSTWVGSAFGVGTVGEPTQYFITNRHCVLGSDEYGRPALANRVYLVLDGNSLEVEYTGYVDRDGALRAQSYSIDADTSRMVSCDVVYYSEDVDFAILKASRVVDSRVALELAESADQATPADTVYSLGYPGISDEVSDLSSWSPTGAYTYMKFGKAYIYTKTMTRSSDTSDVTITAGSISRLTTMESENRTKAIQHDAQIHGGNSGGPLVNSKGQVIGVNTWGVDGQASLNYAVYIDYIREALEEENIPFNVMPVKETTPSPQIDVQPEPITPVEPEPDEPQINLLPIILIAAVVVVAGIVVVVVLVLQNQKKQQKAAQDALEEARRKASAVRTPKPYVSSLAPQHGGMRVSLHSKPILIGRSRTDCTVTFTENTPGVSGIHCSLHWDGSNFVLTDLQSTYGTFLQNGQKLAPNTPYPLQAGTSFWLGDKQNVLRVELE